MSLNIHSIDTNDQRKTSSGEYDELKIAKTAK